MNSLYYVIDTSNNDIITEGNEIREIERVLEIYVEDETIDMDSIESGDIQIYTLRDTSISVNRTIEVNIRLEG